MVKINKKPTVKSSHKGSSVGIVTSIFNTEIAKLEFDSCFKTLIDQGFSKNRIFSVSVPGALEIPFALKSLAATKTFDALIALGVIIRGKTFHFEIVALESASGLSKVALDFNIPIANGILAVENYQQAFERSINKGVDCALVALTMINLKKEIKKFSEKKI